MTDATYDANPPGVDTRTDIAAAVPDIAVRAIGITKTYGRGQAAVTALNRVSVTFAAGRFAAIMGPSGSGKSTLMHCLAGLDSVDDGTVWLGSTEVSALGEKDLTRLRRDRVGFVFQAFNLLPTLTVAENILLPLTLAGRRPDQAWVDRLVDAVGLGNRLRRRPAELSGGEQQRVAVLRALASRPSVVFADEPTGNLDSRSSIRLLVFLRRCVDEFGQTVVMVTHDPAAAGHADRVLFLSDGRVVDQMHQPTAAQVLDLMKALGGDVDA